MSGLACNGGGGSGVRWSIDVNGLLTFLTFSTLFSSVSSVPKYHEWKITTDKVVDVQVAASIIGGSSISALIKAHGTKKYEMINNV